MAKLLFVQNIWAECLGTMSLSAVVTQAGHECRLSIPRSRRQLLREIREYAPDVIGLSCVSAHYAWALASARLIKGHFSVPIVFGGPHPTFFPEIIHEPAIDTVCIGEGEGTLCDLMDRIRDGNDTAEAPNLWVKREGLVTTNALRPLIEDLDSLPFPDRELSYRHRPLRENPRKDFMASRGCPYRCTFCFNHRLREMYAGKGRYVRFRSVENVLSEIKAVRARYRLEFLKFSDDVLILNKQWALEFLERYASEIALPFSCFVTVGTVDAEIAAALKAAGCHCVYFGIESGNERIRREVLKKGFSDEQIEACARLLKEHGLRFGTYNILGIPGESLEQAFETVELNTRIGTDLPWSSIAQPYPRTELAEIAERGGYLSGGSQHFGGSVFRDSPLQVPGIHRFVNLSKLFFLTVKLPRLRPLIRRLIGLRLGPFFDLCFLAQYAYRYSKMYGYNIVTAVLLNLRNALRGF